MEIGPIIALISAACFAAAQVLLRRGVFRAGEAFSAVPISIFIGTTLFTVMLFVTGGWNELLSLSWQGFILLAGGGISHFVLGRLLSSNCVRLIGANKAVVVQRTLLLYSISFAVIFLHESLTSYMIVGILCIAGGAILASVGKEGAISQVQAKGVLIGLAGAFFWGISGVLIKPGIEAIGSPLAATFISHSAAALIMGVLLLGKNQRKQLTQLRHDSLVPLLLSGMFVSIAQLLLFIAYSYSPVSIVTPLNGTVAIFVLLFSFLLNRSIEVFTWKVFWGVAVTMVGTFLLFQ